MGRQTNQSRHTSTTHPETARFQPVSDGGIPCLRDPARGALELRGDWGVRLPAWPWPDRDSAGKPLNHASYPRGKENIWQLRDTTQNNAAASPEFPGAPDSERIRYLTPPEAAMLLAPKRRPPQTTRHNHHRTARRKIMKPTMTRLASTTKRSHSGTTRAPPCHP